MLHACKFLVCVWMFCFEEKINVFVYKLCKPFTALTSVFETHYWTDCQINKIWRCLSYKKTKNNKQLKMSKLLVVGTS